MAATRKQAIQAAARVLEQNYIRIATDRAIAEARGMEVDDEV